MTEKGKMYYLNELIKKVDERDDCLTKCKEDFEKEKEQIVENFKETLRSKSFKEKTQILRSYTNNVNSKESSKSNIQMSSELGGIVWENIVKEMLSISIDGEVDNET